MHHTDFRPEIKPVPIPFPSAMKWRALVDDSVAEAQRHVDHAWPFDSAEASDAFARVQALIPILELAGQVILLLEGQARRLLPAVPPGHFVALSGDVMHLPFVGNVVEIFALGRWVRVEVTECQPAERTRAYIFWAGNRIFTPRDHGRLWRWPGELGGGR